LEKNLNLINQNLLFNRVNQAQDAKTKHRMLVKKDAGFWIKAKKLKNSFRGELNRVLIWLLTTDHKPCCSVAEIPS